MSEGSGDDTEVELNGRAISLTIVAFLVGALAAGGVSVRVIREVKTVDDATSLPPANIAPDETAGSPYQIDPNETLITSTALVPLAMVVQDGQVAIGYELISLAPQLDQTPRDTSPVDPDASPAPVYPRTWEIETPSSLIEGGTASSLDRTARFVVDSGLSTSDIVSVTITEALAPFPIEISFALSDAVPEVDLGFGFTVELVRVAEQAQNSIVQVAVISEDASQPALDISGAGPGWASAAPNSELGGRTVLVWSGGELPDEFSFRATGTVWLPINGEFAVALDGGP